MPARRSKPWSNETGASCWTGTGAAAVAFAGRRASGTRSASFVAVGKASIVERCTHPIGTSACESGGTTEYQSKDRATTRRTRPGSTVVTTGESPRGSRRTTAVLMTRTVSAASCAQTSLIRLTTAVATTSHWRLLLLRIGHHFVLRHAGTAPRIAAPSLEFAPARRPKRKVRAQEDHLSKGRRDRASRLGAGCRAAVSSRVETSSASNTDRRLRSLCWSNHCASA